MNKNVKNVIKFATFVALFVGIITPIAHFLFVPLNSDITSYGSFYKEKENSLDLVMVGSSTVRDGFSPLEAYHEYGITSHSVNSSPTHLEVIKIALEEIERVQSPKVVYVDLNGLNNQTQDSAPSFVQDYYDCMPEGAAKNAIAEKYSYIKTKEEWEFFAHHNGFRQQIYWESFVYNKQLYTKGYFPNDTAVKGLKVNNVAKENPADTPTISPDGHQYLKDILEIATKYKDKTHFIFGQMPRYLQNGIASFDLYAIHDPLTAYYMVRSVRTEVEEAGFEFVEWCDTDFLSNTLMLDPKKDQFDAEHLNHLGAKKFTAYFSKYLMDNYLEGSIVDGKERMIHSQEIEEDFQNSYEGYLGVVAPIEKKLGKKAK